MAREHFHCLSPVLRDLRIGETWNIWTISFRCSQRGDVTGYDKSFNQPPALCNDTLHLQDTCILADKEGKARSQSLGFTRSDR